MRENMMNTVWKTIVGEKVQREINLCILATFSHTLFYKPD